MVQSGSDTNSSTTYNIGLSQGGDPNWFLDRILILVRQENDPEKPLHLT